MIDSENIVAKAKEFDPDFDKNKYQIVSVGRLSPEKHFENAIYAAQKLKAHGINFCWHLIGDGAEREKLQNLVTQLDLEDVFKFEGNCVNPYPYMHHADLFVHPSYVESFGIVVVEALALGIPCVVTKSQGVLDFLQDRVNSFLTEQSSDSLAETLIEVIDRPECLTKLRELSCVPSAFLPESVMNQIRKLL